LKEKDTMASNKQKHTHRGTCQACGAHQAIAAKSVTATSRTIAKHGYTVDYGYFSGTCQGSDHLPAEFDVALTHKTIAGCTQEAERLEKLAADYDARTARPAMFERWDPTVEHVSQGGFRHRGTNVSLPIEQATEQELLKAQDNASRHCAFQARGLRRHVEMLRAAVLPRLGEEPYPVVRAEKVVFARNQRVQFARKDGTLYWVTLLRPAYSHGWHQRQVGWYGQADGNPREGRWTTQELNKAVRS
jgi:hypothetical protein